MLKYFIIQATYCKPLMENLTCQILDSVAKIRKNDWDRVFGDIPEGYEFYRTIEESGLKEFTFFYLILYNNQCLVLIAPIFIADFNLDIAVEGWLKNVIASVRKIIPRFLMMRTIFCGSVFGEHGVIGIDKGAQENPAIPRELLKGLEDFRKQKKASLVMFKDFLKNSPGFLDSFKQKGFFRVNSFPCAASEVNFPDFQGYLQSLGHSTRKNLRRKLKEAYKESKISVEVADNVANIIDEIYGLYLQAHRDGATKFEKLTKVFFLKVSEHMAPYVKYFLYYVNGKLGAFNLCFVQKNLFIDKFIGFDYDISRRHHLYFVSWCYNVEWCIKHSIPFYHTGQTDYEAKVRLGSKLIPLYAYLRHKNKAANLFFKALSLVLKPDNFDREIKT
ncbi:MAG: GNAT family N-acetyltransferase [Candidatus Omnitrophica bacterium]|nr:GNAT family N-acetyltransferase [Candidatus Omnitrophota bacterium]